MSHGLVSIPRRRRPHARGHARVHPGSRVPWTSGSARLYLARGRATSARKTLHVLDCCEGAKRVPYLRRDAAERGWPGVVIGGVVMGVAPPVAQDCCPGQTARLTGVACLSVPCITACCTLSRPRLPLTRVAAMDLNNSYGSARSADMQYGGLNTRFCSCIASSPFANSLLLYSICCLPAPLPLPSHASASAH